jgi:hypothetical protein
VIFRNYTIGDISVGKLNFGVASDSSFNVSFDWRFKRCGQGLRFWAVLLDLSTRGMSPQAHQDCWYLSMEEFFVVG